MPKQAKSDYSSTPLARKLGIAEASSVLVMDPPANFEALLAPLPDGVDLARPAARCDVIIGFCTAPPNVARLLTVGVPRMTLAGGLWAAWPKKTSKLTFTLDFDAVQSAGLRRGLVDNKSCAIDADWQAIRFVIPREKRVTWAH